MKVRNIFILILIFVITGIGFNSCQKDEEQDNPADARDQYIGDWYVVELSNARGEYKYEVTISNDPSNSSQVLIKNFHAEGPNDYVYAIATSSSLTVPEQTLNNKKFSGSGKLVNKDKIEWKFDVNDGADINKYTAVYTRL